MGHVFGQEDAQQYAEWFRSEPGRSVLQVQRKLLCRLWQPIAAQRVLDVGCGTGIFLEWLSGEGHQLTGIDPSPTMLNLARQRLPGRVALDEGYAERLPYEDNAFDTVVLVGTLEFVNDPTEALAEAFRVARSQLLLGVYNKYALVSWHSYLERLWKPSIYRGARFFSVFGLRRLIEKVAGGPLPVTWRTGLLLPLHVLKYYYPLETSPYAHRHPFGHFIAMRVDLRYPVHAAQNPLLCEIGSAMSHPGLHIPLWRLPQNHPERIRPTPTTAPTHSTQPRAIGGYS